MNYQEIKNKQPELHECFFAFSNDQYKEGIEKNNLKDKKIYSGGAGLYGTHEGITQLFDYYKNQSNEIATQCEPQKVYECEFSNHECSYTNDDEEAIKIVIDIFGKERAKEVTRKFGYFKF